MIVWKRYPPSAMFLSNVLLLLVTSLLVSAEKNNEATTFSSSTTLHSEARVDGASTATELVRLPLLSSNLARRRKLQTTPQEEEGHPKVVDALYQGYGEHYVDLWCGMPPQRQTLIVGTGSSGTAFPCSKCGNCGEGYHTDHSFNEFASNSYHQLTCDECALGQCSTDDPSRVGTCNFGIAYVEGSRWEAVEAKDHCYIGGLHDKPTFDDGVPDDLDPQHASAYGFSVNFGCQTLITGLFRTQLADGILGMSNTAHSFWKQMYDANKIPNEIFSLCYVRQEHASRSGTQAGAMTLGGSDDRLHVTPMVFTSKDDQWNEVYDMYVRKIYLREGDGSLSVNATSDDLRMIELDISTSTLNQGPVFIESGTTMTYFTSDLLGPFQRAWNQLVNWPYDNALHTLTYDEMILLPTIIVQFEGAVELNRQVGDPNTTPNLAGDLDPDNPYDVVVAVPPQHYMQKVEDLDNGYYPRFYMEEPPWGGSTIGANMIMGHDVLFDLENRRIGWAESNCNYEHLVEAAGYGEKTGPTSPTPASPAVPSSYESPGSQNEAPAADTLTSVTAEVEDAGGFCNSSSCRLGLVCVSISLVVGVALQRRGNVWGSIVSRATGRSAYSSMPSQGGDAAELELQISYRETELA